jgi:lipoyl(octanoyl) transferase
VAALGIKVSRHFAYHGVALNVAMDLEPFSRINACGYSGLQTVDMKTLGVDASLPDVQDVFARQLQTWLVG